MQKNFVSGMMLGAGSVLGIVIVVVLLGVYKFNYLAEKPEYDVNDMNDSSLPQVVRDPWVVAKELAKEALNDSCDGSGCARIDARILFGNNTEYLEVYESNIPDDSIKTIHSIYALKRVGTPRQIFSGWEVGKLLYTENACQRGDDELQNTFHQELCP